MTINLRTINPRTIALSLALALALSICGPATAREARAGSSPGLSRHDAASSYGVQASRASQPRRRSRASRKAARRSRRHASAPPSAGPGTSVNTQPAASTDIQPATRDDAEENGGTQRPTPTPSLEQQFPKTYKIKKP